MHMRCKFDGGKQINCSQSGAWEGRCAGAGLRQNYGPNWGPHVWEQVTGDEPNTVFREVSQNRTKEVNRDRARKSGSGAKESRRKSKQKKSNDNSPQARRDYSRNDGTSVAEVTSKHTSKT